MALTARILLGSVTGEARRLWAARRPVAAASYEEQWCGPGGVLPLGKGSVGEHDRLLMESLILAQDERWRRT